MGFFSDLYKRLIGNTYDQTWAKIDWREKEVVIASTIEQFLIRGIEPTKADMMSALAAHKYAVAELLVKHSLARSTFSPMVADMFRSLISEHNRYYILEKKKNEGYEDPLMRFDTTFDKKDVEKIEHVMDVMLQNGFRLSSADKWVTKKGALLYGMDVLYQAAMAGNLRLVKFFHERGEKINRTETFPNDLPKYKSSMTAAVESENLALVRYFYENEGILNPEKVSRGDFTPLAMAVICRNEELFDFITRKCDRESVDRLMGERKWATLIKTVIDDKSKAKKWTDKFIQLEADTVRKQQTCPTSSKTQKVENIFVMNRGKEVAIS